MLEPTYLYSQGFAHYRDELMAALPYQEMSFKKGEHLWKLDQYIERVFYLESGVVKTSVVHEDGYVKTLYFSGVGSVYPGCHDSQFNIEKSLLSTAVTPVKAIAFSRQDFYAYAKAHPDLLADILELYATWINLHIYESAHQEYNSAFRKLCNLLYLLCQGKMNRAGRIDLSQQDLADILALERENVSRFLSRLRQEGVVATHRGWLEVLDLDALLDHCSLETSAI